MYIDLFDQIDENLKRALQDDLTALVPGLLIQGPIGNDFSLPSAYSQLHSCIHPFQCSLNVSYSCRLLASFTAVRVTKPKVSTTAIISSFLSGISCHFIPDPRVHSQELRANGGAKDTAAVCGGAAEGESLWCWQWVGEVM